MNYINPKCETPHAKADNIPSINTGFSIGHLYSTPFDALKHVNATVDQTRALLHNIKVKNS